MAKMTDEQKVRADAYLKAAMICAKEMQKWAEPAEGVDDAISIGAVGAAANCCAAIMQLAWHEA